MNNLDSLIPINQQKGHSIKEVVFAIFLVQPIVRLEKFKNIDNFKTVKFQKIQDMQSMSIQFMPLQNDMPKRDVKNTGLQFIEFDNTGTAPRNILQISNEPNKTVISFHTFDYTRWIEYKSLIFSVLEEIKNVNTGLYISAFSLTYVDSFLWKEDSTIPLREVFRQTEGFIPSNVLESEDAFVFSLNKVSKSKIAPICDFTDKTEITANANFTKNNNRLLTVSHSITPILGEVEILDILLQNNHTILSDLMEFAHTANKVRLKQLFVDEVTEKIKLK
jgi:uncharacterized protein (TIGR04255 family)